jgi:hypothetical protein
MISLIDKMKKYSDFHNIHLHMERLDNPTQEEFWLLWVAEALALGLILEYVPEEDMESFQLFDGLTYGWYEDKIIYEGTVREDVKRYTHYERLLGKTNYTPDGVIVWNPKVKDILFNELFEKGDCYFKAQFHDNKWFTVFDVKAPRGVNRDSDIPFSFTRKWMWQRYHIYVNKVMCIPPKPMDNGYLYKEVWTPQRYMMTDALRKARTIHYRLIGALDFINKHKL